MLFIDTALPIRPAWMTREPLWPMSRFSRALFERTARQSFRNWSGREKTDRPIRSSRLGNMHSRPCFNRLPPRRPVRGPSRASKTLARATLEKATSHCAACEPILLGAVQPSPATSSLIKACGPHSGSVCSHLGKQPKAAAPNAGSNGRLQFGRRLPVGIGCSANVHVAIQKQTG